MKHNEPKYTQQQIQNVLKICSDLGKITKEQAAYIESVMNFPYQQAQCEKRNKKPFWERFSNDFADLLADYGAFIWMGDVGLDISFVDDVQYNWHMDVPGSIGADDVRRWPGIYERQKKVVQMMEQMPEEERTLETCQKLLRDARIETGIFAKKSNK